MDKDSIKNTRKIGAGNLMNYNNFIKEYGKLIEYVVRRKITNDDAEKVIMAIFLELVRNHNELKADNKVFIYQTTKKMINQKVISG